MAEGFVLNISKEMLQRLDAADKKIVQIGESAEKTMKKINEAFGKKLTGVEDFIKQLNDIQQQLSKKDLKVNVDLALKNGALDSLKKQIEALGITIPVGVTATGTGGSNSAGVVPNGLNEALSQIATTIEAVNKTLASVINKTSTSKGNNNSSNEDSETNKSKKAIKDYEKIVNELGRIEKKIYDIKKAQDSLNKDGFTGLDTNFADVSSRMASLQQELTDSMLAIEEKYGEKLENIQTKRDAKELSLEQKQAKDKIDIQEKELNDLIKIEEQEFKEYERLMGKMLKLRKDINKNSNLIYSTDPKVSQDALAQIAKQEELLKKFEARAKTLENKHGASLSEIQIKYSQKELDMLNKAINNPNLNSGIDQKTKDLREYEKVLKRISDLEKIRDKASKAISKYGANSQIGQQANAIYQQAEQLLQRHNKRKIDLELQYGAELDSIKQAQATKELNYLIQQNNQEISEYEKVRSKILEINKTLYENNKTLKNTKDPNLQAQINNQNQALLNERSKLATRQLKLERKHGNSLLSVQTQIGQKEVEFERKKQQDKIREVQQALRRRQDIERRWAQRNARLTEQKRNTADGALSFSQNEAKTIGQKLQAIKYLQNAQKSLDVTTSQGRNKFNELNREIKKTENELRRCGVQMNNFQEKSRHLFDITGQLGRALSLMFSVSQITQYVSKMVNVRMEMELQQRSLQVLLQSKDKANELWNQTLDLAVKSPFRVKELVTYTKQLAAYRIESDKLFETNKMLADVSAGLGVDMQRLILAFGQVKSASFLRGCLGKGTPIRLYNEDIKEVQNIVVGDVIMGDDNTPRNVKEIIYGKEQMYIVKQGAFGDDYRVNENHILTLKDNITATIVDVYVKDYLKDKERYNGVKISADGNIIDYPIELIKDNIDEYFGFVIDGNKRFLLGDGTITHNTELRQFTEAGIPMWEELSKYFSEIYGKSVSVAEVFDMISKRMVTFTDVEKVFQRMTGAGGVFFNMQEELSQTTAGMISNLQDSIDLMFNEIGKKNQGLINWVIKAARYLVDNWETVGKVMKGALVTLLLYKTATMDISKITKGLGANVKAAFSLLKENPLDFVKTFKGNIILTALTAIASILAVIVKRHLEYKAAIKEIVKEYDKLDSTLNNLTIDIYQTEELDEAKQKLLELKNVAKSDFGINVDIQLQNLDSIEQVREEFNKLDQQLKSMNDFIYVIKYQMVEEDTGKEKRDRNKEKRETNLDEDLTNDMARSKGLTKDMEQLDEYSDRLNNTFIKVDGLLGDLLKKQDELNDVQKQFVKAFDKQGDTESDADFFNRRIEGLKLLAKQYEKFYDEVEVNEQSDIAPDIQRMYGAMAKVKDKLGLDINAEEITRLLKDYNQQLNTVNSGIKDVLLSGWGNLNTEIARLEKEMKSKGAQEKEISESIKKLIETYYTSAIKSISTDKEWDDLKEHQAYLVGEQIAKEKGYTVNLVPKMEPSKDIDLKAWQKAYNEEVDEILNTLTSNEDKAIFLPLKIRTDLQGVATTQDKQLATINEAIDTAQKELDRIEKQKTNLDAKLKSGEITQKQYDDLYTANIEKWKKLIEQLTQLRDLLGGDDDKSKGGKDTATQRIKDQISLIRQLYEEYQKLTKEMGATKAFDTVMSSYKRSINNLFGSTLKVLKETPDSFEDWIKEVLVAREDVITKLAKDLGDESKFLVGAGVNLTREELKDFGLTVEDLINGISVDKAWEISNKKIEEHKKKLDDVLATYSELELTDVQYNELFDITWQGGAGNVKKFLNIIEQGEESLREYLESINGIDIVNKVGNEWVKTGKKVEIDINQQIDDFKNATTHAEKMAVALRYYLVTLKENPFGEKAKVTMKGLLNRAMDRATSVGGSKSTQIIKFEDLIDFTNKQGVLNSLKSLESQAKAAGEDAYNAYLKAFGETSVELELMFYIDERNKFENQIKDMFSDYELSLELDKLNIPKNLASQLFGVDTVDLDEIKTALQNKLNDLDSADISLTQQLQDKDIDENLKQSLLLQQKGNKQLREQTEANLRKISDMEKKELEERLKTYTKYLLNEQHERVKIRMETLRMLQEVEDIEEYTPAQRQTITDKIKEEERKKLAQQTWKDFEQSPMYMQMFDDVENMGKGALESLITQMGTLKDELQSMGLPASDLKEILGAINKAEEELERRNPFKNFAKNAEIAFNRANKIRQLEEQRANQQKEYEDTKSTYNEQQDLLVQEEKKLESLNKGSDEYKQQLVLVELLRVTTNHLAKSVNTIETNLFDTNNQINDINDSSNDFYDQLKNIGSITKSVVDGIFQITDAMSWLPEETQLTIDRLQSLSNNVFGIAGGIGSIMSGDIIGGITQIIGSLSGLIATFVEWSSGTKEATIQIERQGRILSNLQNKYDRLNEAIDEAWNTRQIKEYNAELEKNLQQQIIAQKAIIAAQESIKDSDKYGSEQWLELQEARDELQNLYDMQQELQDNIYEKITGGIIDNTLDAISSWVDAWYDAFKETGDGLKGLEENFNEMLLNLVKRQAVMKVAGRFIDQWNSVLERYVNNDDNLSLGEITSWANMIEQDLPALSSQLETFFKAFDGILGDTQGNLSGLQRGISSITESQADILASYANSCRFLLASIDTNLSQLASRVMSQTGGENPMVEQLRVIAQQTSAINTLLNSLTAPHPTQSGRGLKVVI